MSKKQWAFLLLSMLGSRLLSAQPDSVVKQMDEVVITATKSNLKQSQTGKIVTVLDQKLIDNNAGRSLSQLLSTQAGFFINGSNNSLGTNLDVYFRGSGGGNMLVVIDGMPVYDPSQINNSFDLNSIALEQVERIEILRGGQSTLWGSDAVAGVIQIFLKKGAAKKFEVNGALSAGSYQTIRGTAGVAGSMDKISYSVQYNYTKSQGFPDAYDSTGKNNFDKEGFEQNSLLAELNYKISNGLTARGFGSLSSYRTGLDAGAFMDDKDYTARNTNNVGGLLLIYRKKGLTWNLQGSYQRANRSFLDDSATFNRSSDDYIKGRYIGNSLIAETFGNGKITEHFQWVGGAQYIDQNTEQSYLNIGNYGSYKTALGKDSARIQMAAVYASFLMMNISGFNFEAGVRVNKHSIYGINTTYTFNPYFRVDENSKLFVNISSGYKIPSLYQLYSEFGNKNLKPESSTTYELGLQTLSNDKKLYLRLAAFKRDTRNMIIFFSDPVTFNGQYINRDKQNDYGFEIESNIQLGNAIGWSNNFSFVDGQGMENEVKVDNLYRRPNFIMNSALTLQPVKGLTFIPSFRYVGKRLKGPFDPGPTYLPAYYILDLFAGYEFIKNARLFIDLYNVTNQLYFDIPGYNSKQFNMMVGVNFKF